MKNILYSFLIIFTLFLTGCADAGKNQNINANTIVTLDGSASTPSVHGTISKYYWKQVKGKRVTLSNKRAISPTFTAPNVKKKRRLIFRLITKETGGIRSPFKSRDYVVIMVMPNTDNVDTIKPIINLVGDTTVIVNIADNYKDAGAIAHDNKDGNITPNIIIDNPVDITTEGNYTIRYNVSDASGNMADEVTRTVIVRKDISIHEIHGTISDIAGNILNGVKVYSDTNETFTDINGYFSLTTIGSNKISITTALTDYIQNSQVIDTSKRCKNWSATHISDKFP